MVLQLYMYILAAFRLVSSLLPITTTSTNTLWCQLTRATEFVTWTKARGLAQHGGLPGWPEESDPAGVIVSVMDWPYHLVFLYRTGCPDRRCELMKFPADVI
jgi:hypothetical protein